ncbi:MAG: hypothetical protein AVDCRST_MAG62-2066, partial [uncultured Sphingomonas sp.]
PVGWRRAGRRQRGVVRAGGRGPFPL